MLQFSKQFLDAEEREGFLVNGIMKCYWAAEMELLAHIGAVCDKYGLPYYADYGTLLGTIRHKGYVPWDDDIDIAMKRADFNRLMEVLEAELPKGCHVYNPNSEEGCLEFWACVVSGNRINTSPEYLKLYHNCPFVVGVDIYPLDYVPRDVKQKKEMADIMNLICQTMALSRRDRTEEEEKDLEEALDFIYTLFEYPIDRNKEIDKQLWRLTGLICGTITEEESDELTMYYRWWVDKEFTFKKEWYSDRIYKPFENMMLPIPVGYHEVLTTIYGDYMVPVRGASSHGYPAYQAQLDAIRGKE